MKRKIVFIVLCILCIPQILYLQFGRSPFINNITTDSTPQGYSASLSITANKLILTNQNELANHLIQQTIDNDFENMQLSYDILGYPSELTITVYTNKLTKQLHIPAFRIKYEQETPYEYNIKENPEMFTFGYEYF